MDRRTFLQRTAKAILSLGAAQGLLPWGKSSLAAPLIDRYLQTLAQPSARKLALLVGINQYPRGQNLMGCLTDVELQRELLIHRFGFLPEDILILKDKQATREDIETAFIEHLTGQAQSDDVVVFHFSGYGSQVDIPGTEGFANSLIPVDGSLQTKGSPVVNELLEDTLILLAQSLATKKVTMVLDTSYVNTGKDFQGNLKLRSYPKLPAKKSSPEELAFQEKLLLKINTGGKKIDPRTKSQLVGSWLTAAGANQIAVEGKWDGFSAGLFTYALTQYLWQVTPPSSVQISLKRVNKTVEQVMGKQQQPRLAGDKLKQALLAYYLLPAQPVGAEGVVVGVEDAGKSAQVKLCGLPPLLLDNYGLNSRFLLLNPSEQPSVSKTTQLQLRSREGLTAKARLVDKTAQEDYQITSGQLVQELIRILPRNLTLTVAFTQELERIERVDATSAFANLDAVSSLATLGEQKVDCLFGRFAESIPHDESKILSGNSQGGYGLYTISGLPIPNTEGIAYEAIKPAVNRLAFKLESLLAAKFWHLSANEGSSRLGIKAILEKVDEGTKEVTPLTTLETLRLSSPSLRQIETGTSQEIPAIAANSQIQFRIKNTSNQPIYAILVGIDSAGNAIAFSSPQPYNQEQGNSQNERLLQNVLVASGETLALPNLAAVKMKARGPAGVAKIQLIASYSPFQATLEAINSTQRLKMEEEVVYLEKPLAVAKAILEDLHQGSAVDSEVTGSAADVYALDVKTWASLSFVYQIV
ncbi:MAG: caspase family protein [Spirulinaceae cyanobacterium]